MEPAKKGRVALFDILRGVTIISMVLFHAAYDIAYIHQIPLPWFTSEPFQDVWRCSISWTFLALAGWMTFFSRNNLRRAGAYGAAAVVVFIATTVASVDTAVSFGILYCMAASTLVYVALRPLLDRLHPALSLVAALALFALTYAIPRQDYAVEGLAWLGFPSPAFTSGDYYPLVPYVFMYLAGACASRLFATYHPDGYPSWMCRDWCPPLSFIGRHSLIIYLAHQPLLIVICAVLFP